MDGWTYVFACVEIFSYAEVEQKFDVFTWQADIKVDAIRQAIRWQGDNGKAFRPATDFGFAILNGLYV